MATKVYLSPSNQEHNVGKGAYGTEEEQMHALAKRIAARLRDRGFLVRKSEPQMEMYQVTADSNNWDADCHVCLHTNAGGGDGTVAFYGSAKGKALSEAIYKRVAPLSPGKDEGLKSWPGLYEIARTSCPCAYLELFFHDNAGEVADYLADEAAYADAVARGICDFYGVKWTQTPAVDYRPLKRAAVAVAKVLGIRHDVDLSSKGKGESFEQLLRRIADHKEVQE
jgi:N-acetylmuramoyl-L-alanine amidase